MRLRLRSRRGDAAEFERIRAGLSALAGVTEVHARAGTGSILVTFEGDGTDLLNAAREQGLFDTAPPPPPRVRQQQTGASIPTLDLAAAGLAAAGMVQVARGQIVGSASENLWNAYGLYAATGERSIPAMLAVLGVAQILRGRVLGSATSLFLYAISARRMARHLPVEDTL